jgi:hypothetical protein
MHIIRRCRCADGPWRPAREESDAEVSYDLVLWYYQRYHHWVASVEKIISGMRDKPKNVRYEDLNKVCEHYFGPPRTTGGSHAVFKTPWPGDPRVNVQNDKGKVKPYQVR